MFQIPSFSPRDNVPIPANDSEAEAFDNHDNVDQDQLANLEAQIPPPQEVSKLLIHPAHFDKDDSSNFHMDFIVAASNTRAVNYGIATADRHKSKLVNVQFSPIMFDLKMFC